MGSLDLRRSARILEFRPRAAAACEGATPDAETLFAEAFALEGRDAGAAREGYRRVLAADPAHADAHLNVGRLLHEEGDLEGARIHYRLALAAGERAEAAFNLGTVLEDLGRAAEAVGAYEDALALDPRCADAHYNLALLHERHGARAEAFRHLLAYRRITAVCA